MATQKEIAQFFRLALRLGLLDTAVVERWVESIIAAEPVVKFPFTELVNASRRRREHVDDLLGQVTGHSDLHIPGRIVLALLRRRLRDKTVTPETAVKFAREIGFAGPLTDDECYTVDGFDDALSLATSGTYGSLADVRRKIAEFLERYARFDEQIPLAA